MHINPDHFLNIDGVRVIDAERSAAAWQQWFTILPRALEQSQPGGRLYVLVGAQGAGKSTWPIVVEARRSGVETVAVWFQTSLESCLARNAGRPPDQVVPERNIRNVYAAVEPPTMDEGFAEIVLVPDAQD